jgi:hypothetical protein
LLRRGLLRSRIVSVTTSTKETGAADDFEALGAMLIAAEAAAGAAEAFTRAGDRRAATAALRRSVELASACEGAVTPGLFRVATVNAAAVPLSGREREIAMLRLICARRTNRRADARSPGRRAAREDPGTSSIDLRIENVGRNEIDSVALCPWRTPRTCCCTRCGSASCRHSWVTAH